MDSCRYDRSIITLLKIACMSRLLSFGLLAQDLRLIDVEDHRPLVPALNALEAEIGIPINYEDPPYVNEEDLQDVSTPQQRSDVPGFSLLVPRKGKLTAEFNLDGTRSDPSGVVYQLLTSYEHRGLPGEFGLLRRPGGFLYVVPTKIRDVSGKTLPVDSPLDAMVSLPTASRTVFETFTGLLREISKTSGVNIDPGAIPILGNRPISFGVSGEPGRDALTRLITTLWSSPVSYRLLYDPMLKSYMFNLNPVPVAPLSRDHRDDPLKAEDGPNPFFDQTGSGQ